MIRVIKDWAIDSDGLGYQVGKLKINKDGKEKLTGVKYPLGFSGCLEYILKAETMDLIMQNNMSLTEAIKTLKDFQKEFSETVVLKIVEIEKEIKKRNGNKIANKAV